METVNPLLASALEFLREGNVEAAETGFGEAASACCEAYGERDIITARTLAHVARVSSLRGKKEFAIQMYERILRIHEALPVPVSYDHAIALSELAAIQEESESQEEADTLRRRADAIVKQLTSRSLEAFAFEGAESEDGTSDESSGEDDDETDSNSSEGSEDKRTPGPAAAEETPATPA